jgi:hypothetical protein
VTNVSSAVSAGYQSLYEYNFDNRFSYIHPFITDGENITKQIFRPQISSSNFDITDSQNPNQVVYSDLLSSPGANITSSYLAMTASLKREQPINESRFRVINRIATNYKLYSRSFEISALGVDTSIINIPQVMFGSAIKKGSVELNFYATGTLVATATDYRQNGELVQTNGTSSVSGSVVGLVFYNEGLIFLSSSAELYNTSSMNRWLDFGMGLHDGTAAGSGLEERSFEIKYKGTNYVNTMTMFCHARAGELNLSNNPTSIDWSEETTFTLSDTGSAFGFEERQKKIKNVVSSSIENLNDDFKKTTYISKINMYDDKGNLIGVASLAQPIRKEENNDYTFKIELDT